MRRKKILKSKKIKQPPKKNHKYLNIKRTWTVRPFKYSFYPYLLIISFFRRNLFLTLTNHVGNTKYWINAGRCGFTGRTRIDRMAIIKTTQTFLEKLSNNGINKIFLIFKNYNKYRRSVLKGIKDYRQKKALKVIALTIHNKSVFNGCRRKKSRRR